MTYSRSLQGRFVTGKYTPVTLLLLSLMVWGIGVFVLPDTPVAIWAGIELGAIGTLLSGVISLACTVMSAFLLSSLYISERRIHWLTTFYLWIAALSLFTHANVLWAVSGLIFMVFLTMLFVCQSVVWVESSLFAVFALLGFASLLLPQFLMLLPLGIVYMLMANIMSTKRFMAALLGLLTPFWLVYGTVYVCPAADVLLSAFNAGLDGLACLTIADLHPMRLLLTVVELSILLPAAAVFVGSSVPGKPMLRRRLSFVMVACAWLMLLSWLSGDDFGLYYVWRMPGIAILASYVLTVKMNKFTNVYFVFINLLWLAVAALSIWQI